MQRYFIPSEQFGEDTVTITGDDARHIGKVMRSKPKDQIIVSDGAGKEAVAELVSIEPQEVQAAIVEFLALSGEPWLEVTIAQSLPKGDKMETVIQKCTEIGASAFVPFLSARTIVQYDERKEEKRAARWRKIAKEAAEQAHRSKIPVMNSPVNWGRLLATAPNYDLVCLCYEKENGEQLRDVLAPFVAGLDRKQKYRMMVVVGPEGGFTEEEVREAEAAGARSVGLGRRILRTETAGMAALTCILYETGEMGGL
ncbi:16S rRNA (uracil(1498)-N(3))-methyltransferase [Paenibacillus sp. CAA11]|uniref:16S rRNA (uracil(1498)-N(3))-methyltransferase n=1 Tax=Paenibacillus sp. CAA11 TaxID=1532905 RepID=UPI000D39FC44|nr:16S rRNA (uracil(1498)-N(3))-methyltransferase [Paenibacillus sp. CAA11]AWB45420.1 16S rRNA (uracil(1498)-N(3))-methyltransferase [Paenibacillus sp. CAA11]